MKLARPKPPASKRELNQIARLEDQLGALLVTDSQEAPVGNLEGHDIKAGKCRVILSCPNADALEAKLKPLLEKYTWPNGFTVKKMRKSFYTLDLWD